MDQQPVLKYISCVEEEVDEGSSYSVHRNVSQGDQRASGIWLLALLTFLPSFEGKYCDLTRSFIDLKQNCDDLRNFFHRLLMLETTLETATETESD